MRSMQAGTAAAPSYVRPNCRPNTIHDRWARKKKTRLRLEKEGTEKEGSRRRSCHHGDQSMSGNQSQAFTSLLKQKKTENGEKAGGEGKGEENEKTKSRETVRRKNLDPC